MNDYDDHLVVEKFQRFEKILLRYNLIVIGIGMLFLVLYQIAIEQLGVLADLFIAIFLVGLFSNIITFGLSIIRIFKYLLSIRKIEESSSIWRSVLTLFLSPFSFILYYFLIFIAALSSCSA